MFYTVFETPGVLRRLLHLLTVGAVVSMFSGCERPAPDLGNADKVVGDIVAEKVSVDDEGGPTPDEEGGRALKTREDVKASFDANASWLEAKHGNTQFMFCENVVPSYGSSKIDFHGWVFRRHSNQWERLFLIRTNGVGGSGLSADPNTGIFSAKGTANNKFKNKTLFTFDLSATEI